VVKDAKERVWRILKRTNLKLTADDYYSAKNNSVPENWLFISWLYFSAVKKKETLPFEVKSLLDLFYTT
jgi:hypothetical protein